MPSDRPHAPGLSAAHLHRLVLTAMLLSAAGWLIWHWRQGAPVIGLAGALLVLSSHALLLGAECLLAAWVTRHVPGRPTPRQWRSAWLAEVRCSTISFGWQQPFRSHALPDVQPQPGQRGMVLVHGHCCNRALWQPWLVQLHRLGIACSSVSLTPVHASIDHHVLQINAAVSRLEQATGQAPLIVAHSMGGLVVRAWLCWLAERTGAPAVQHVHRVLTIASPHAGTWLARWGRHHCARQMRQGSPWLQQLAATEPAALRARFVCVGSTADNIVFPVDTTLLPGAQTQQLPPQAHLQMLHDPQLFQLALKLLSLPEEVSDIPPESTN